MINSSLKTKYKANFRSNLHSCRYFDNFFLLKKHVSQFITLPLNIKFKKKEEKQNRT